MTTIGNVAAINRYPVKSLQGETVEVGTLQASHLEGDRSWGIVDVANGHVLTAKREDVLLGAAARLAADGPVVTLPDGTVLAGPGPDTDRALSDWLGRDVALREADDSATSFRMSFNVDDPDVDAFEWMTPQGSFLDLAPIHVLSTAALAAAAALEPTSDWSVHRFRPTLLLDTGDAEGFVEDDWVGASLVVGEAVLEVTMPTIRCSLPTKAQSPRGLARDLQVFKALAAHHQQNLGAYANIATPGTVRVGDPVELRRAS